MGLDQVKQASIIAYYADVPVLWEGSPGTGKTSFGYQMSDHFEVPSEVIIGSLSDPTDVGGHPIVRHAETGEFVSRVPDEQFYRLAQHAVPEGEPWRKAIAGLDELNWSPPAVQATMLRFAQERKVGGLDMHEKVWPWSALNPGISGAYELLPSLANRFWHGPWEPTTAEWIEGEANGWPFPEVAPPGQGFDVALSGKRMVLLGFLKANPDKRQASLDDLEETVASGAWFSGRTWAMAMRLLATAEVCGINGGINRLLVKGCVGEVGDEFIEYMNNLDLPDPDAVLADPLNFEFPQRGDKQYATIKAVVARTLSEPTPERKIACWKFLARCVDLGKGPVAAAHAEELALASRDVVDDILPYLGKFQALLTAAQLMGGEES